MVDNPQLLVSKLSNVHAQSKQDISTLALDAIFVPFRDRSANVNALLNELQWYGGPIYLMPSSPCDMEAIVHPTNHNVYALDFKEKWFTDFFYSLSTSKYKRAKNYASIWDLPLKRNYALWYARSKKYKNILLVDDDIRRLTAPTLLTGTKYLSDYVISGCFVEDFPDTSILGHLELEAGETIYPFLSGSFLLIRPFDALGFFPIIYNEDWLFMLPHVIEESICSFGSISQLPYDPFSNPNKAVFEEFGEIIAEGLYALVVENQYESRHDPHIWRNVILERRETYRVLRNILYKAHHQRIINIALRTNMIITAEDCVTFIKIWETDIVKWKHFIEEAKT